MQSEYGMSKEKSFITWSYYVNCILMIPHNFNYYIYKFDSKKYIIKFKMT
jgi:hypothetical protein